MKQFQIIAFICFLLLIMDICACFAEDVNNGQDIIRPRTRPDMRYHYSYAEVKTYTMTVHQLFGGGQSPDSATVSAVTKAKREALEQAGTYIESMTLVRDSAVAVDEIFALAAGLLKTEIVTR